MGNIRLYSIPLEIKAAEPLKLLSRLKKRRFKKYKEAKKVQRSTYMD